MCLHHGRHPRGAPSGGRQTGPAAHGETPKGKDKDSLLGDSGALPRSPTAEVLCAIRSTMAHGSGGSQAEETRAKVEMKKLLVGEVRPRACKLTKGLLRLGQHQTYEPESDGRD